MNIGLEFGGWFQCRLATDPDPTDEPRGASGTTFAVAGEPDLDAVIRLHDPSPGTERRPGPSVGVWVRRVRQGGREAAGTHPLVGARVDLLGEPRFYSRNRILGAPGHEPIHPFHLRITGRGLRLDRRDPMDPAHPRRSPWEVPRAALARHAPHGVVPVPAAMVAASGVEAPRAYVEGRLAAVTRALASERNEIARLALGKRERELRAALATRNDRRIGALSVCQQFHFDVAGLARVTGRDSLAHRIEISKPWRVRFDLGVWDADTMCGYMMGTLDLPLRKGRAR